MIVFLDSNRSVIFKYVLHGILSFIMMYSLSFCNRVKTENKNQNISVDKKHARRVILQPFIDFTKEGALDFAKNLKMNGLKAEVSDPIEFPVSSWNSKTGRYRA